ncbi:MAG: leucine-rich repeat domain-containing protein [Lachnospiraceae bacterium]|nr:leucine-rich repeat domain-containing protein [Lachnospiraceae bacterium]
MSKVNGILTCPICGYNESSHGSSDTTSDSGEITKNTNAGTSTNTNIGTNTSENSRSYNQTPDTTSGSPYEQNSNTDSQQNNAKLHRQYPKQPRTSKNASGIRIVVLIIFACIFVPAIAWFFAHERNSESSPKDSYSDALSDYYDLRLNGYDTSKKVPQTPFFIQTVCRIFNKEIDDISAEDLAQVISLRVYGQFNNHYTAVDYTLADGTSGTVYPAFHLPDVSYDLTCFVNLEELYLEDSYPTLNLSGLDKLHTLYVHKSDFDKIAETISPSQITSLGIYNGYSFLGLSDFSNVESLYLDNWMNNEINEIADLPKLKKLTIVDGFSIDDLSVLYNLTQLESLSIDSESLTDITFLTKFDHLTELTIKKSKVLNFNPLAECTGLKKLYLLNNYETTDYEFIKGMTQLTELGLITSVNYDDPDMPDFSTLSNVTKLHVGRYASFGNLITMTNLEELIIEDGRYSDFGDDNALLSLPKLRSLTLIYSSVSPEMLKQVSEVKGLEYLDLQSSHLYGSVNPILSLPNLKELNLRYTSFMMDADSLSPNKNLRVLDLNKAEISKYNSDPWADREDLDIDEIQKALANFHGMEALTVEDLKINSVEFATEMEHLKLLNIKDNNVDSLAPLENLQNLQLIVCEANPISDTAGLDDILLK